MKTNKIVGVSGQKQQCNADTFLLPRKKQLCVINSQIKLIYFACRIRVDHSVSQDNSQHQDMDNDGQGVGEETSWHSLQQHHLHPHYSVSILDETINRPYTFQAAINRVIAGRSLFVLFSDWLISRAINLSEKTLCLPAFSHLLFFFLTLLIRAASFLVLCSFYPFYYTSLLLSIISYSQKKETFKGAIQIKKLCIYLCSVCVCTCILLNIDFL